METSLVFKLKGFGNRGQRVEGHMGVCGRADISGQKDACPWCICVSKGRKGLRAQKEHGLGLSGERNQE